MLFILQPAKLPPEQCWNSLVNKMLLNCCSHVALLLWLVCGHYGTNMRDKWALVGRVWEALEQSLKALRSSCLHSGLCDSTHLWRHLPCLGLKITGMRSSNDMMITFKKDCQKPCSCVDDITTWLKMPRPLHFHICDSKFTQIILIFNNHFPSVYVGVVNFILIF